MSKKTHFVTAPCFFDGIIMLQPRFATFYGEDFIIPLSLHQSNYSSMHRSSLNYQRYLFEYLSNTKYFQKNKILNQYLP